MSEREETGHRRQEGDLQECLSNEEKLNIEFNQTIAATTALTSAPNKLTEL